MHSRSTLRIVVVVLAALGAVWALAPAGMAKPDKPGKPTNDGRSLVTATADANLAWVNAAGDVIHYRIEVSASETVVARVDFSTNDGTVWTIFDGSLTAGPHSYLETYAVTDADLGATGEQVAIEASVAVLVDGAPVAHDAVSVIGERIDRCPFVESDGVLTAYSYAGGICWFDFAPGEWSIISEPDYPEAGRNPRVTMRDHLPGNWCQVGEAETVGGSRTQPASITIPVSLPSENPFGFGQWFDVGVCGLGGLGRCTDPECFLPVGNPHTFVLDAPAGVVTATERAEG